MRSRGAAIEGAPLSYAPVRKILTTRLRKRKARSAICFLRLGKNGCEILEGKTGDPSGSRDTSRFDGCSCNNTGHLFLHSGARTPAEYEMSGRDR